MRFGLMLAFVVVIALASAQQAPSPTDRVAWGSAVNGLRIGAAFGSDPSNPTLRVLFQNVGSTVQDVLIGDSTGKGRIFSNMKFTATAPDGMEREGSYSSRLPGVGGFVEPLSIRLITGETHELEFPLTDIIIYGTAVRLDALLQQGYSVRVRIEVNQAAANWYRKLSDPWIGTVSSAEASLAH
jgi:hypothetical protein